MSSDGDRKRDKLKQLTTGWAGRTLGAGRMAASLGRHVVTRAVAKAEDRLLGEQLASRMDEMKGLVLKVGQMASYLEGALPPEAQAALRRLQRDAVPMEAEVVRAVLDEELGPGAFEWFDPEPLAAASIGQVHRARVDGREVAVKVQYPGIASTFEVDLANLDRMSLLATLGSAMDRHDIIGELRDRLRDECDYLQEAANLERFAALWAHDERMVLPRVLASHTTARVLTTTLIGGVGFYEFAERANQEERDRAGGLLFEFAFGSIFAHAAFNGDPHPGNYLFLPDGRVGFLDFGCVRWFEAPFVDRWKRLARVVLEGREGDFPEVMRATGIVGGEPYDYAHQWRVMGYLYAPFLNPGFRYDHAYVKESWDLLVLKNPNLRKTRMPREWVFSNRLQWGLNSVLAHLNAGADWGALYRDCLERPLLPAGRPAPLTTAGAVSPTTAGS